MGLQRKKYRRNDTVITTKEWPINIIIRTMRSNNEGATVTFIRTTLPLCNFPSSASSSRFQKTNLSINKLITAAHIDPLNEAMIARFWHNDLGQHI